MIFLWVFSWYSYWIFMKQQINTINIIGAVISAGLFVVSHFLPVRRASSSALKLVMAKNDRDSSLIGVSLDSQSEVKMQIPHETFASQVQSPSFNQGKKSSLQASVFKTQKLESESLQLAEKFQQEPPKSNGCPKNLEYFTQKPRPKEPPEECMTCTNLIACVCRSSN